MLSLPLRSPSLPPSPPPNATTNTTTNNNATTTTNATTHFTLQARSRTRANVKASLSVAEAEDIVVSRLCMIGPAAGRVAAEVRLYWESKMKRLRKSLLRQCVFWVLVVVVVWW